MAAEILNKLRELQEKNAYPMHMPGHKRVVDFIPFLVNLITQKLRDWTTFIIQTEL